MKDIRKLYETFGELIYVIAMIDGVIQPEELKVIEEKLSDHPWGEDIKWSFDYEVSRGSTVDELYKKVISYCKIHGPDPEFDFLIDILEEVAKANDGVNSEEQKLIDNFSKDLLEKFKMDLSEITQ
ncbi:tellurite resistance TerB family protein [Aquimarina agarilytica]|uniref:tellurite resistance TerB family protein n=1 Tax=Aquimarina agarilytica TaxID=1087449 RepID=UPI0002885C35|nr:TerB family tellurite resistance protein [Aquimarina agarilytica]